MPMGGGWTQADLLATGPLVAVLAVLARVDRREHRLPDRLTYPLAVVGLCLGALRTGGVPVAEVVGWLAGFGLFWAVGAAFWRLRGVDGLGLGDAKLLGAAGAWTGWAGLPWIVLLASVGALMAAVVRGTGRGKRIAFGPWLALGFASVWIAGLAFGRP